MGFVRNVYLVAVVAVVFPAVLLAQTAGQLAALAGAGIARPAGIVVEPGSGDVWRIDKSKSGDPYVVITSTASGGDRWLGIPREAVSGKPLDLAFAPPTVDHGATRLLICFSEARRFRITRFDVSGDGVGNATMIFESPASDIAEYNACRLDFRSDGALYVALPAPRDFVYALDGARDLHGYLLRLTPDGDIPSDNPYMDSSDKHPAVWSRIRQGPFIEDAQSAITSGVGAGGGPGGAQTNHGARNIPRFVLPDGQWRLISLPGDSGGATALDAFGDDIQGVYGTDWVMYDFDAETGRYHNPGPNGPLALGVAYWIIQLTGQAVTLALPETTKATPIVDSSPCTAQSGCAEFLVTAKSGGIAWNMFGASLESDSPWDDARLVDIHCGSGCTPTQAEGYKVFHSDLWRYDGDGKRYAVVARGETLKPWEGYFGAALESARNPRLLLPVNRSPELQVVTGQLVVAPQAGENANARLVISGKHFKCAGRSPYQALVITRDNVTITDSLFTDCYTGIIMAGARNTVITGNRFENVGLAIREKDYASGTQVTYNEFEGVGVFNCLDTPEWGWPVNGYWSCDVYQSVDGRDGKFNHNIVDNRGYVTEYLEDFVNLYGSGGGFEVSYNLIIGSSEPQASSASGGCVIVDGPGSGYTIQGNRCYETAGYGIGDAGGNNVSIIDNTVYLSRAHALTLSNHPSNPGGAGSFAFTSSRYYGPCGENVRITNNRAFAWGVDVGRENFATGQVTVTDTGKARNLLGGCFSTAEQNQIKAGNSFFDGDPILDGRDGWGAIPVNVFNNLGQEYFSGRRG